MKFLALFILFFIASCATPTKQAEQKVEKDKLVDYSFEVDQNYQAVYLRILEQGRECIKPQFTAKMVLEGEVHEDIKAADISVVLVSLFSNNHYMKIRIEAVKQNKSKVRVLNELPRWNNYALEVKKWVLESSTECGDPGQHYK